MVLLHQHQRGAGARPVAAGERRGVAGAVEFAAFEQQAGDRGDQQIGLIAVREHFEQFADLLQLARRVAPLGQHVDQTGRLKPQRGLLGLGAQGAAVVDEGRAANDRLQALPQHAEEGRVVGVGHCHHAHPRHLQGLLHRRVGGGAFAVDPVLGQRMQRGDGGGQQAGQQRCGHRGLLGVRRGGVQRRRFLCTIHSIIDREFDHVQTPQF
ncbi:hypothetical protein GALL_425120 [mine drainage metagenome]|uniref:Uncharacterized protein n=1 Tax=mine drainage metagenome TaxID=410659 RepID=A0A1J5QE82_9ZZZZ